MGYLLVLAGCVAAALASGWLVYQRGLPPALRSAGLAGADLRGASLRNVDLTGANLRRANLAGADLEGAHLRRADLRRARLDGADLRGADLRRADLRGANLHGANLRLADLEEAGLAEARYDLQTAWPDSFQPRARGATLEIGGTAARAAFEAPSRERSRPGSIRQ